MLGQELAHPLTGAVDFLAVEAAVRSGEVDEFENTELRVDTAGFKRAQRPAAIGVDDHHLARVELAYEMGADDVEGRRLRGKHPTPGLQSAEAERAKPVGVAQPDEMSDITQHEREGPLETRQDLHERRLEIAAVAAELIIATERRGDELSHEITVAGYDSGEHSGFGYEAARVGEIAVVAQGEAGIADFAVDGLGIAPRARPGGRVPRMTDGEMTLERRQLVIVEDIGDEAHVLVDPKPLPVADRHAGRLLAAMLQGVQAVEGEKGSREAGGVHAEDSARLFRAVVEHVARHAPIIPQRLCFSGLLRDSDAGGYFVATSEDKVPLSAPVVDGTVAPVACTTGAAAVTPDATACPAPETTWLTVVDSVEPMLVTAPVTLPRAVAAEGAPAGGMADFGTPADGAASGGRFTGGTPGAPGLIGGVLGVAGPGAGGTDGDGVESPNTA